MSVEARALVALGAAWLTGCVSNPAPPGFLLDTREAQREAVGGWIEVTTRGGDGTRGLTGELLAAGPDTVWIMAGSRAVAVPTADLVEGSLVGYDPKAGEVAGATLLGVVSTASNGAFLIFTAPMWAIGGSIAASSQSKVPMQSVPAAAWVYLSRFARFPQGLPSTLDPATLRPVRR